MLSQGRRDKFDWKKQQASKLLGFEARCGAYCAGTWA